MTKMPQVKKLRRSSRLRIGKRSGVGRGRRGGGGAEDLSDGKPLRHLFAFGDVGGQNVAGGDVALEILEGVGTVHLAVACDLIGHMDSRWCEMAALRYSPDEITDSGFYTTRFLGGAFSIPISRQPR